VNGWNKISQLVIKDRGEVTKLILDKTDLSFILIKGKKMQQVHTFTERDGLKVNSQTSGVEALCSNDSTKTWGNQI
jgi:hypothetical protein